MYRDKIEHNTYIVCIVFNFIPYIVCIVFNFIPGLNFPIVLRSYITIAPKKGNKI